MAKPPITSYHMLRLGGSSGDEYTIQAARKVGQKWIIMQRTKFSELGSPGFRLEWAIFNTATINNQNTKEAK